MPPKKIDLTEVEFRVLATSDSWLLLGYDSASKVDIRYEHIQPYRSLPVAWGAALRYAKKHGLRVRKG